MLGTTGRNLKPTEPVWKSAEPPRPADPPTPSPVTQPQPGSRGNEADDRTLIIGPGVSVKGEITSCNRLIVQGTIEAKLTDCPNIIIKEGGVFKGNLIVSKRLLVQATGRVSGTITYGEIEIERGGKIAGEIKHEGESAVSHLKPARAG